MRDELIVEIAEIGARYYPTYQAFSFSRTVQLVAAHVHKMSNYQSELKEKSLIDIFHWLIDEIVRPIEQINQRTALLFEIDKLFRKYFPKAYREVTLRVDAMLDLLTLPSEEILRSKMLAAVLDVHQKSDDARDILPSVRHSIQGDFLDVREKTCRLL